VGRGNQGSLQKGKESATGGGYFASSKVCRDIPMGGAMQHTCREDASNDQRSVLLVYNFAECFAISFI